MTKRRKKGRAVKPAFREAIRDRLTKKQRELYAKAVTVALDEDDRGNYEGWPGIGCGVRRVVVTDDTPSKVRIMSPANGGVAWIKRDAWDNIVRCAKRRGLMT